MRGDQHQEPSARTLFWLGGCFFFVIGSTCGLVVLAVLVLGWGQWLNPLTGRGGQPVAVTTPALAPTLASPAAGPSPSPSSTPLPTASPVPTPEARPPLGLPVPGTIDQRPIPPTAWQTLANLWAGQYPPRDFYETEDRLGNRKLHGRTTEPIPYAVGQDRVIYVDEQPVTVRLLLATEHAFYWADPQLSLATADLLPVAERLENDFYKPLITWLEIAPQPGIDGEARFHIIHVAYNDVDELGYFDSSDQFPRDIFRYSNEHDAIYLNMNELFLGEPTYYGTLIHEIEHLLHWQSDPNETTWLDEGLAELMEVRFDLDTFLVYDYLDAPDIQLNGWSSEPEASYAHYAGAGLFLVYFWEQLGDDAVRDLFWHPADGLASVRSVLATYRPETTLEAFMNDFYAATYLQNPQIDPRYGYQHWLPERPVSLSLREPQEVSGILPPYGVDYITLDMTGDLTVSFAGDTRLELYEPASPLAQTVWLAPAVNSLDATLTAEFDLRQLPADSITLRYQTWYELETDYDFAYVLVSTDGGVTWDNLRPPLGEIGPFGRGYNGNSSRHAVAIGGWLDETLSLSRYAGEIIQVRFEVLTDAAVVGRGFALSDIVIPELGPAGRGNWQADGFVPSGPILPQQWSIQVLRPAQDPAVVTLPLDPFNQGRWRLELNGPAVIAIAPLNPFTARSAEYWLAIERTTP